MKATAVLTFALALALGVNVAQAGPRPDLHEWVDVHAVKISRSGRVHERLTEYGSASDHVAEHVDLEFTTAEGETMSFSMNRATVFSEDAVVIVNYANHTTERPPPQLPVYEANTAQGWIKATLMSDGTVKAVIRHNHDTLLLDPASAYTLRRKGQDGIPRPVSRGHGDMIMHRADTSHPADGIEELGNFLPDNLDPLFPLDRILAPDENTTHRRRQLSTIGTLPNGPPYGLLENCPTSFKKMKIGFVADAGFVAEVGGGLVNGENEVASIVNNANAILLDQARLRLEIKTLIVNVDDTGDFPATGPNFSPISGGRNRCPHPAKDNTLVDVRVLGESYTTKVEFRSGPLATLGLMGSWISQHAPGGASSVGVWHYLTDCFPPGGTTGVAWMNVGCGASAREMHIRDTGNPCGIDQCPYRLPNGNEGIMRVTSQPCGEGRSACMANAALTSFSGGSTWRTFLHEVRAAPRAAMRMPAAERPIAGRCRAAGGSQPRLPAHLWAWRHYGLRVRRAVL